MADRPAVHLARRDVLDVQGARLQVHAEDAAALRAILRSAAGRSEAERGLLAPLLDRIDRHVMLLRLDARDARERSRAELEQYELSVRGVGLDPLLAAEQSVLEGYGARENDEPAGEGVLP